MARIFESRDVGKNNPHSDIVIMDSLGLGRHWEWAAITKANELVFRAECEQPRLWHEGAFFVRGQFRFSPGPNGTLKTDGSLGINVSPGASVDQISGGYVPAPLANSPQIR